MGIYIAGVSLMLVRSSFLTVEIFQAFGLLFPKTMYAVIPFTLVLFTY